MSANCPYNPAHVGTQFELEFHIKKVCPDRYKESCPGKMVPNYNLES